MSHAVLAEAIRYADRVSDLFTEWTEGFEVGVLFGNDYRSILVSDRSVPLHTAWGFPPR